jgi:hypothetical protein
MTMSGELIRMQNYVDDISTTLRRILATLPMMTGEEKKQLAEYLRKSVPGIEDVLRQLEGGAQ